MFKAIFKKIAPSTAKLRAPETQELDASVAVIKKPYLPPQARKLGTEQGILILVGRAWAGDKGARELLELIFPGPGEKPASK